MTYEEPNGDFYVRHDLEDGDPRIRYIVTSGEYFVRIAPLSPSPPHAYTVGRFACTAANKGRGFAYYAA